MRGDLGYTGIVALTRIGGVKWCSFNISYGRNQKIFRDSGDSGQTANRTPWISSNLDCHLNISCNASSMNNITFVKCGNKEEVVESEMLPRRR